MTTTLDILRHARGLIEQGWTQGAFARDADGHGVNHRNSRAVCFCGVGAIRRAADDLRMPRRLTAAAWKVLDDVCPDQELLAMGWQDEPGRTQSEVLAMFDRAIEREAGR